MAEDEARATAKEIGRFFGIEQRQVRNYAKEAGVKSERGKGYLIAPIREAWLSKQETPQKGGEKYLNETRLRAAQAENTEIEVARKRRELAPVDGLVHAAMTAAQIFASGLDAAAAKVTRAVGGDVRLKNALADELNKIRQRVAAALSQYGDSVAQGQLDRRPAANKKSGGVGKRKSRAA